MQWDVLEHTYTEKTNDWFAATIVIAGALVALMFYLENYLSIALVIIGTFTFLLLSVRRPENMMVKLTNFGVIAGNVTYPFSTLDAYNVVEHESVHKIILESKRFFAPLHIIPIADGIELEEVRDFLADYLPEKEMHEPFAHRLMERLGF
jgi:hypothetical protein